MYKALLIAGVVALPLSHTTAGAQEARRSGPDTPHVQAISINPLGALLGFYTGEYERRVSPTFTVALGASHWRSESDRAFGSELRRSFTSAELKLRLYPSANALKGFNMAAAPGVVRVRQRYDSYSIFDGDDVFSSVEHRNTTSASIGFELGYNWLLGAEDNVMIALGGGAKRLVGGRGDFVRGYPTIRLGVGYAF